MVGRVRHAQHAAVRADVDRSPVRIVHHRLHTGDRARGEKVDLCLPVVGRSVRQADVDGAGRFTRRGAAASQACGRASVQRLKGFVETAHAAEAGSHRDFDHRQTTFVQKLFGQQYPSRLRHGDRRNPQMLLEQAPQLPFTERKLLRKTGDIALVQSAGFDQLQGARECFRRVLPSGEVRRNFRPAAQAGAEAGVLGRCGVAVETYVLAPGCARATDRAAIDAG